MPKSNNRRKNGKKGKKWKPPGSSFSGTSKSKLVNHDKKIGDSLENVRIVSAPMQAFGNKFPDGTELAFVDLSGNKTLVVVTKNENNSNS